MTSGRKVSYSYIKDFFDSKGCLLLTTSDEYINTKHKLKYMCLCGNESSISWHNFKSGQRCYECRNKKISNKQRRLTNDEAQKRLEQVGVTLVGEFKGIKYKVKYICKCGELKEGIFENVSKGHLCYECGWKRVKHDTIFVRQTFIDNGCIWLGKDDEYKDTNSKLTYKCNCGRISKINFNQFQLGVRCVGCRNDKLSLMVGEKNPNWNPDITEEERKTGRNNVEYYEWRRLVFQRDNFTCQCCNKKGGEINAHHLESYHKNKELRHDLFNGITLCKECHTDFHKEYGYFNNTSEQFYEFQSKRVKNKAQQLALL